MAATLRPTLATTSPTLTLLPNDGLTPPIPELTVPPPARRLATDIVPQKTTKAQMERELRESR